VRTIVGVLLVISGAFLALWGAFYFMLYCGILNAINSWGVEGETGIVVAFLGFVLTGGSIASSRW